MINQKVLPASPVNAYKSTQKVRPYTCTFNHCDPPHHPRKDGKHRTQDCSLGVSLHSVRELQWSWATAKERKPRTKYRVSRM
ncbi:hypothetical protein F5Y00DRAFT_222722 [Daldinia vernicosa]|uniref:uncharacterized protein n=1 Tax=Daldinia vernicosa TaxID=114800 RepID=UPI002007B16C|nr:uncharacterized protein F5Y00DRAFT_222722 [Daldinia vernicosa]KAI0854272.1 hypothetical protein F5Y00DRAFT_222722 [Daldinia vernicosa]